jgi:hypothetical protein
MNLDDLIAERLDLLAEQEKIKARLDDNAAALAPMLADNGGRAELDGLPGQGFQLVEPAGRFSTSRLEDLLGPDKYRAICTYPPSSKKEALQVVPGAIVDLCMLPGSGRPSVRKIGERRG